MKIFVLTPYCRVTSVLLFVVFVTYAQEVGDDDHIRTVVQISQTLFKNSIDVTVDVLEETVRAMSISDWLESNISTVSPSVF